jgi:hypothetical protein
MARRANHEIRIRLVGGKDAIASKAAGLKVGQTVHYKSRDGAVRVVFPKLSPFRTDKRKITQVRGSRSKGSRILTLKSSGSFPFRSFIKPPGKRKWDGIRRRALS